MNVPEQSTLSIYASGEILSARQKADNGRPKGDVSRLLVTGDTSTVTAVCGFRHADGISLDA